MAPKIPMGANIFIILFDINTSGKQEALSFLSKVLYIKQLSDSKDIGKVYIFNTDKGVTFLDVDEIKVVTVLEEIQNFDVGEDSFIEALHVGINELKKFHGTVAVNLQLLLITDFANCTNGNKNIDGLIDDLNNNDIFLYIIGPNIRPNKLLLNEKDLIVWKKAIPERRDNSRLNTAIKLIQRTKHSVISDYELGIHLFNSYKCNKGMQPWNVPLAIGSQLELAVSTMRITKEEAPFKLNASNKRIFETPKWVLEDEEDKEVEYSDMISGIIRHGKFVKIETDAMFKADNPRSFALLGFTDQVNIPEYYFQCEATYMVVPDLTQSEEHTELFSILVDELAKAKLYGLARKVYNNNNEPKFVALIPRPDMKVKCFILFELPYADDVAYSYEENDVKSAPKVVKDENIYNFLNSINISGTKSEITPGLGPRLMLDPSCIDIVKKVEEKMLGKQNEFVKKELIPSQEEAKLFETFSDSWPKREIVKIKDNDDQANNFDDNLDDFTFDD